jgi:hypothetical protein
VKIKEVIELLNNYVEQDWKAKICFDGKYYPIHAIVPAGHHPDMEFAIIWSGNIAEEFIKDSE